MVSRIDRATSLTFFYGENFSACLAVSIVGLSLTEASRPVVVRSAPGRTAARTAAFLGLAVVGALTYFLTRPG